MVRQQLVDTRIDRDARQMAIVENRIASLSSWSGRAWMRGVPYFNGSVRMYVPLSFNKGGLLMGVTPQLRYSFSNNLFAPDPVKFTQAKGLQGVNTLSCLSDIGSRQSFWTQRVSASVRGYIMLPRASSQVYPRWGIGLEGGLSGRPGMQRYYAPNLYAYAYGYVPGFTRAQGLRLTTTLQTRLGNDLFGELGANTLPRGFSDGTSAIGQTYDKQWKVTADYAIPIYVGDISIPWVAYITHFIVSPHADFTALWNPGSTHILRNNLWCVGADISASLARLLFLPFDASIGLSVDYLGGSRYAMMDEKRPWSVGLIFGVDF